MSLIQLQVIFWTSVAVLVCAILFLILDKIRERTKIGKVLDREEELHCEVQK